VPEGAGSGTRGSWFPRWFWPSFAAPATIWLILLFVVPFYVILSIAFGRLDPLFLTPIPVYDPARWAFGPFRDVLSQIAAGGSVYRAAFLHTAVFVGSATALCLVIGYPPVLVAFVAPFWISYMMRMLAWINLLQPNGYVNRVLQGLGLAHEPILWLNGKPITVILGLTYGYVPYMILPLFGSLDRIDASTLEASRDLGAGQLSTFLRVTLPLSRQAILAGIVIVALPMFGDYFTTTLLAGTRDTAMIGNLIVGSMQSSLVQTGASLVLILLALLLVPMLLYLRSTSRAAAGGFGG
jgi:ABC-type spermidine/putrescine transport system permease subunit I